MITDLAIRVLERTRNYQWLAVSCLPDNLPLHTGPRGASTELG